MALTEAERRMAHVQALADTRIEGHVPTPEFLADCEAVNCGTMTLDQLRARSLQRSLAAEAANDNERAEEPAKTIHTA